MVINGLDLLMQSPITGMLTEKHTEHGVSHGLGEVGYDIRLKQTVEFSAKGAAPHVYIDGKMKIGHFVIASAMEEFKMPLHLMGIVHDKSSWARKGLSVFNTVIEPGWRGFLTLELVYHGNEPLLIPAGAGIAQVVFHQTSQKAEYGGKYQDQANEPVAAINA